MEGLFPTIVTNVQTKTTRGATQINVITTSIPESTMRVVDLILLLVSVSLNLVVVLIIAIKRDMRTSTNLYIVSLSCSSSIILIQSLQTVLRWLCGIDAKINMDYVCLLHFDVSVLTATILSIEMYIGVFQPHSPLGQFMSKKLSAAKGIMLIWITSVTTTAVELHIYDFFEGVMDHIYVWNTIMFTVCPTIIVFVLDCLVLYELAILKAIEGSWRVKELRKFFMLVNIMVAILSTLAPYRFATAIHFIEPKAPCCTDRKREVLYLISKTFPIIFPIIYIVASNEIRAALRDLPRGYYHKSNEEAATA